ncbi:carbohydrate ABC transporter permease [Ramlibacter tataouinensis]|uniref:Candidate ABC type sugar transport system, permease component n=1 Tax=Ramlibacter tataouinensis (strain ATCC BAA-407 / DSM 14655 / LMG 21543 / TTB310) TaxID=365046 RepID=F5XW05_RAMTT|nr:sugar ABC transporter permease [Ramlibacter tataouinensis]AEG94108.1 candidate ABC type sugar transport system, permease component [Ramlibacter tataouinensis TTB310]
MATAILQPVGNGQAQASQSTRPVRWHIAIFLAPALTIYTLLMALPLAETFRLAFFRGAAHDREYAGLANFRVLILDERWAAQFWNALANSIWFFSIHLLVMIPLAVLLAALLSVRGLRAAGLYRTAIFMPTMLSFVIIGFVWKLILSPLWGVAPTLLAAVGLESLFQPWLGKEQYALTALGFISVWQYVGIPMVLSYAAMLAIPAEVLEAAEVDGITGLAQFFRIRLPLLWPTIGVITILTFVSNFNSFELVYTAQGVLAGPNFSSDILGTLLYRTLFGAQLQLGDPHMGATVATMMFLIVLMVVCGFLFFVQRKLVRYQF